MKRLLSCLILPFVIGTVSPAQAGQLAGLAIIDQASGAPLQIWRHAGQNWVVGQPGQRYSLQINNKTNGRLLAVMAVDGINIITGNTAAGNQSGYVFSPGVAQDIAGWRKNMQEVAAFYFTNLPDSYAARTGRGDQAGVIGVALYREQASPPISVSPNASDGWFGRHKAAKRAASAAEAAGEAATGSAAGAMAEAPATDRGPSNRSAPAAQAVAPMMDEAKQKLGTGHGERIESSTGNTEFQRASTRPAEVITVYYDSYANLLARGVIPRRPRPGQPQPFPGGFVPDPS
jgi:pyruvate/2-oxoglutarate dehydrogenase complex dihydrolipoamide acyltransferase (E2) component